MSHKIIEKRRRDRMNSCLADLSHLIPSNYLKKGRGRIEKTEIVEMAIKHIKYLHSIVPPSASMAGKESGEIPSESPASDTKLSWRYPDDEESFKNGFNDCLAETVHFLVNQERIQPENPLCTRLVNHLKSHLDQRGSHKQQTQCKTENPNTTADSDYCSLSGSATNSEVGSVVSNTSSGTSSSTYVKGQQSFHPIPSTSSATSSENAFSPNVGKRKSVDDMPSGKFKFKDSIRERFSHEFESLDTSRNHKQERHSESRRSTDAWTDEVIGQKRTETIRPESKSERPNEVKKGIPIFALHPKGTHYIPMPVDEEVVQPFLHLFEQGPDIPVMLHPITIPVNFCGPIQLAAASNMTISTAYQGSTQRMDLTGIKKDKK